MLVRARRDAEFGRGIFLCQREEVMWLRCYGTGCGVLGCEGGAGG